MILSGSEFYDRLIDPAIRSELKVAPRWIAWQTHDHFGHRVSIRIPQAQDVYAHLFVEAANIDRVRDDINGQFANSAAAAARNSPPPPSASTCTCHARPRASGVSVTA